MCVRVCDNTGQHAGVARKTAQDHPRAPGHLSTIRYCCNFTTVTAIQLLLLPRAACTRLRVRLTVSRGGAGSTGRVVLFRSQCNVLLFLLLPGSRKSGAHWATTRSEGDGPVDFSPLAMQMHWGRKPQPLGPFAGAAPDPYRPP